MQPFSSPLQPYFAWVFYLVLLGLLIVAAWSDLRTLKIPKALTLTTLTLGVVINVVRGVWLAIDEQQVWAFGAYGPVVGGLDGLLFSLAGFATGFVLFTLLWLFGTSGGGDVKLVAGLGAWIGPWWTLLVALGAVVVLIFLAAGKLIWNFFSYGPMRTTRDFSAKHAAKSGSKAGQQGYAGVPRSRRRLTAMSLPVAVSVALLVPLMLKNDLQLFPAKDDAGKTSPER